VSGLAGRAARLGAVLLTLAGCAPKLPDGVDPDQLEAAVSRAIGDPGTCVLIAPRGQDRPAWRYNTHTACARPLPACDGPGQRTVGDLLAAVARDGQARVTSCASSPDGARSVAWAAGPVAGRDLVYAAVMEGERAFPGRIVADRLEGAFEIAGLARPPQRASS
jgi:hypothetical protein